MAPTSLPPLDLVGPDGHRLTVRALDRDDTVAALAARLGRRSLSTSRGPLDGHQRLIDLDELRVGTRLEGVTVDHERLDSGAALAAGDSSAPKLPDLDLADFKESVVEASSAEDSGVEEPGAKMPVTVEVAVEVAVVAGPSVTGWAPLLPGRHVIGRAAHAQLRLHDPSVEPHHALVTVADDGGIEITQLSGAVPLRVDGEVWQSACAVQPGDRVVVGSSVLRFRPLTGGDLTSGELSGAPTGAAGGGTIAAHPSDPWRRVVWRAPFSAPVWSAEPVVAPAAPSEPTRPSFTGLIGVAVTAMGAVVIAQVMGNPMFMLFAAMGVIASVTTFVVGVVTARRQRSRLRDDHAARLDEFRRAVDAVHLARQFHHRAVHRSLVETFDEAVAGGTRTWQRRLVVDRSTSRGLDDSESSVLRAIVGVGTCRWRPEITVADAGALDASLLQRIEACSRLAAMPAPLSIRPGDAVALHGPGVLGASIARSVIAQLATWIGPSDWQLVVVSRDARSWRWTDWLPHGALESGAMIIVDESDGAPLSDALDAIDDGRTTLLVTDAPELFTARTGALRRFMSASGAASIVVVDIDATVPAMCRRVLTVGSTGSASWSGEIPEVDDAVAIEFGGVSIEAADRVARSLACLVDPEDDGGTGGGVPSSVSFGELIAASDATAAVIAQRWRDGGTDPAPCAPLGSSVDGRIDIDLVRDGPHGLIAGTTGSGKSELLRTLVLSLAASIGPQHLNFVLVDYKGGSTFDACTALPHTVGLVTDLDDGLAERALVSLDAELHRRERMLRSVGASDLTDYRSRRDERGAPLAAIARLVVVIDEFAALAKELPDFLNALVGIAQRGRSLGVHLLLATQRPAGVVNDDIRANTNLRIALRLHDRPDALDVVGDELPAKFPRGVPGRAALRLGPDELVVFQAGRCTDAVAAETATGMIIDPSPSNSPGVGPDCSEQRSELDVTVEAIVEAARIDDVAAPHRPWVEPLPFPLAVADIGDCDDDLTDDRDSTDDDATDGDATDGDATDGDATNREATNRDATDGVVADGVMPIGVVDDPHHQRRVPLSWGPADGGLGLVGSIGSGTTSTMISLAAAVCGSTMPDRLHLYVIDARGDDGVRALASLAHCGGVVRVTEEERLHRLLRRVVDTIDERMAGCDGGADVVVMIDGYASVRSGLGAVERQATFDLLQRVVHDGPAVRVTVVLADDASSAMSTAPVPNRWLFHLDDPSAARGMGLRAAPVPDGKPGRLRVLATGLEAQVALGAAGLASLPTRDEATGGPELVRSLPEVVDASMLCPTTSDPQPGASTGSVRLVLGMASDDLGVAMLEVAAGDHVLVLGGPRTGVSTALGRCVAAWEAELALCGLPYDVIRIDRRTVLDASRIDDSTHRVAIVVDDAHRIDDSGLLTAIAKGEHPHVTIIAGGRADALRAGYGHWTREVAKARCGIVMSSRSEPDGDLLGAPIPRRPLVPARPGLAWLVDGGALRMVQIATDSSEP